MFAVIFLITTTGNVLNMKPAQKCTGFMRGSRKFCQMGSNFDNVFYDVGREDPNSTISGPSLARQRNAIKMAFRWRADDGPTLNAGLVALWLSGDPDRGSIVGFFFRGFGLSPSGSARRFHILCIFRGTPLRSEPHLAHQLGLLDTRTCTCTLTRACALLQ